MSSDEIHVYQTLFVQQLEKYRALKGVSQREMSLSLGQTAGYISKLVNPKENNLPRMLNFFYMCDYLGVHPKEFFDDKIHHPELIKQTILNLYHLKDEQLKYVASLIRDLANSK